VDETVPDFVFNYRATIAASPSAFRSASATTVTATLRTTAPSPGAPGQSGATCALVTDLRTNQTQAATHQGQDPDGWQRFTIGITVPQGTADGLHQLRGWVEDCANTTDVSPVVTAAYRIDNVAPVIDPRTLRPRDFGNTRYTSTQRLSAQITDTGGSGVVSVAFTLIDHSTHPPTETSYASLGGSGGWYKSTPVSLVLGRVYRFRVSGTDAAGNSTTYEQTPVAQNGGWRVISATPSSTSASIPLTPCQLAGGPPASGPDNPQGTTTTVTCSNVPVDFAAGTITLSGNHTPVPRTSFVDQTVPLVDAELVWIVGGVEVASQKLNSGSATTSVRYDAPASFTSSQTLNTAAKRQIVSTLSAEVPITWQNASIRMVPQGTTPSLAECPDATVDLTPVPCTPDPVDSSYIVVFNSSVASAAQVAGQHASGHGTVVTHTYEWALKGYAAAIPDSQLAGLAGDSRVAGVQADDVGLPLDPPAVSLETVDECEMTPGSNSEVVPCGIERIRAADKANKGSGIRVAVIDTAVAENVDDLTANIAERHNCIDDSLIPGLTPNGHGTRVAGIIAARENGFGVVGVAPEALIVSINVMYPGDTGGVPTISTVMCGLDIVASRAPELGGPDPIYVANMSFVLNGLEPGPCLPLPSPVDALHMGVCENYRQGVTLIAAAGNNVYPPQEVLFYVPGAYNEVITVTQMSETDGVPCGWEGDDRPFGVYASEISGDQVHLLTAPTRVMTTHATGYGTLDGTSAAAPHVAGAAALLVKKWLDEGVAFDPAAMLGELLDKGEAPNTARGECGSAYPDRYSHFDDGPNPHPEPLVRVDLLVP
jgi:subtilisin family serine protease